MWLPRGSIAQVSVSVLRRVSLMPRPHLGLEPDASASPRPHRDKVLIANGRLQRVKTLLYCADVDYSEQDRFGGI